MEQKEQPFGVIGVVGLGLIGGSLGLDLQSLGFKVHGLTHRKETAERAIELELASKISTNPSILTDCSLIILALPIKELLDPTKELLNCLPQKAVITDVGSVKEPILKIWKKLHPRFVASHPMAGTNKSGVESGRRNLFQNRTWVCTPDENTNQNALKLVKLFAEKLGSRWIQADARAHDEAVALISHLPVLISAALLKTVEGNKDQDLFPLLKELASSGFADTTRVGGGNPTLGAAMASSNTNAILKGIKNYQSIINDFEKLIKEENWPDLKEQLNQTKILREEFFSS